MIARRWLTVRISAALCVLVGSLVFWSVPAQATVTHKYLSRFSEVPAEGPSHEPVALPGPVTQLGSMTVDASQVWIAENMETNANNERVDEFSAPSGGFLAQPLHFVKDRTHKLFGLAVGHLTGEPEPELYVAKYNEENGVAGVDIYSASGAPLGTWTGAKTPLKSLGIVFGVAVDNSVSPTDSAAGRVYVPVASQKVVDVFKAVAGGAEEYVTQLTGTCATPTSCTEKQFEGPTKVAVNSANGNVLVKDGLVVDVFEPTVLGGYAFVRQLTGTPTGGPFKGVQGLAVDSGSGDIYVEEGQSQSVDQFSSEGVYVGHLTETSGGPFTGVLRSVAVDSESHDVYVGETSKESESGNRQSFVDVFGPDIVVPDVVTEPVSEVKPRSAMLNGTVNPAKAGAANCVFVYGTSKTFGNEAACSKAVAEGENPVGVHAVLSGLLPDTTYFYRLQASNASGTNLGEPSQDQQFTTSGPGIHGEFATAVTSSSALVDATIDPHGSSTSYYFQYGQSAAYETSVPLAPGAALGSGEGDLTVSVNLQSLAPGTTYHYHVVAVGEPGGEPMTVEGADQTFTTQGVGNEFSLPDGRAWEMVTPPNKQGAGVYPLGLTNIQASVNGSAITYGATGPIVVDPAGSNANFVEYAQAYSARGALGRWDTQDIDTTNNDGAFGPETTQEYKLFSTDLSLGLVEPPNSTPLPPLPAGSEKTVYLRNAKGEYEALVTAANVVPAGAKFGDEKKHGTGGFQIASATPDLSHVVLTASYPQREAGLYEWSDGRLQPVSVLPSRKLVKDALLGDEGIIVRRAISSDGSRVIWRNAETENGENGRLYLRDMVRGETVQVDAAQGAAGVSRDSAYLTADTTGSRVFFTSKANLTVDARLPEQDHSDDLYVFEVTSARGEPLAGKLTDLTVDQNAPEVGNVLGVVEASEDGASVYFVANGVLGDGAEHGASPGDCHFVQSILALQLQRCNLYVDRYDTGSKEWKITFIAALSGADAPSWGGNAALGDFAHLTSRVSPNGRFLAFMSDLSLTGYDNRDANSGVLDEEVFLYDSSTGHVVCASCNPTGARPVGASVGQNEERYIDWSTSWEGHWLAANIPKWTSVAYAANLYQPRYLFNDGRLFFNSIDALVPADVNGQADVYQYEPTGIGGCQGPGYGQSASVVFEAGVGGCVGLLSAGTSAEESAFMDASESGGDVFFLTSSRLSSQDYDTSLDIYDAHECTPGAPCAPATAVGAPPCVTGDACKAAPSPQPAIFGSPASATFSGAGNIAAPASKATVKSRKRVRCKRGLVRKRGRCVKRSAKRATRSARRGK